jgi:hypothetical protein
MLFVGDIEVNSRSKVEFLIFGRAADWRDAVRHTTFVWSVEEHGQQQRSVAQRSLGNEFGNWLSCSIHVENGCYILPTLFTG